MFGLIKQHHISDKLHFLNGFLRHPRQVGSIIPSSNYLKQDIIEMAGIMSAKSIVELGPGTGGTTRAFLQAMAPNARLLAIEINPQFVSLLQNIHDPRLLVHNGNAADLNDILALYDMQLPDAIVSGIPFSTMPQHVAQTIINVIAECLSVEGRFLAYQFRDHVARVANGILGPAQSRFEFRNIPPVHLYCWKKHGSEAL